jgi:hypothetical protein
LNVSRRCIQCGGSIARDADPRTRYCSKACKQQRYRSRTRPAQARRVQHKAKIPPSNGYGDKEIDRILNLGHEATLRNTLLKAEIEKRVKEAEKKGFTEGEKWKEERVLDKQTAKKVGDYLAGQFDPS